MQSKCCEDRVYTPSTYSLDTVTTSSCCFISILSLWAGNGTVSHWTPHQRLYYISYSVLIYSPLRTRTNVLQSVHLFDFFSVMWTEPEDVLRYRKLYSIYFWLCVDPSVIYYGTSVLCVNNHEQELCQTVFTVIIFRFCIFHKLQEHSSTLDTGHCLTIMTDTEPCSIKLRFLYAMHFKDSQPDVKYGENICTYDGMPRTRVCLRKDTLPECTMFKRNNVTRWTQSQMWIICIKKKKRRKCEK